MTPTVISRPAMKSSTMTSSLPGWAARAALSAPSHSSGVETFDIPTDEPSDGGLTTTGRGNGDSGVSGEARVHFAVGRPLNSSTILDRILSIAMREDFAPGPV